MKTVIHFTLLFLLLMPLKYALWGQNIQDILRVQRFTLRPYSDFQDYNIFFMGERPKSLGIFSVDIPDETYTGKNRYYEKFSKQGFPYTMFNKNKAGWSLETELNIIIR